MSDVTFYDSRGEVVAYKSGGADAMFLWNGTPVAILSDQSVYTFSGRHIGWFIDGWIRDHSGGCVYFTEGASGGPARPARAARPARGARSARPARGARQARPARPARQVSWSPLSVGPAFFNQ
ncbi:4-fold beta flower protein [Baekduia alba]|uniref:4-fold beta flower protein n=1 Tax=Baekduia alba TaxID=2997333 RepID=UPI003D7B1532